MKNVPVPVYCRPLVEKDPNRKVRSLSVLTMSKKSTGGIISKLHRRDLHGQSQINIVQLPTFLPSVLLLGLL